MEPQDVLASVATLARPYAGAAPTSSACLRGAFQRYLAGRQQDAPRFANTEPLVIGPDDPVAQRVCVLFDLPAPSREGYADGAFDAAKDFVGEGLRDFRTTSPLSGFVFDLLIDTVFVPVHSAEFGSETTSQAIGVMWINPLPAWTIVDLAELYVHELTHTLLFVDEHRYGHYRDVPAMMEPKNFVRSAIRAEPRPVYAAFHSVVVACELLAWRMAVGQAPSDDPRRAHPVSATLVSSAREAVSALDRLPSLEQLVRPRVLELIDACESFLAGCRP